uniref:RNase NYN domain-containing protein n=1 Tax=Timema genevievae TaxID=629358 RepID=A0A7R9PHJ4_TIMGE|nr:unnamed protein product [Timema genevievae]
MEEEPGDIPTTKDVLKAGDIYSRALKCQGASEELWSQFYNVKDFVKQTGAKKNRWTSSRMKSSNLATSNTAETSYGTGNNIYNPNSDTVLTGLRPVIIDGSNVAMGHGFGNRFSCRGLEICIKYFLKREHKVIAFVPTFRKAISRCTDPKILDKYEKSGQVVFTPSRRVQGSLIVPYDDRQILEEN